MANSIDELNYYDALLNEQNPKKMSESWIAQLSALIQTLNGYLTPYGILAPRLTTDQRNSIQAPINGQIIYNITLDKLQGFEAGSWQNLI